MPKSIQLARAGSVFIATLCLVRPALAQQATAAAPKSGKSVEEVVVTASKRASTVQKTAASVTAISGADIKKRGLTSVSQLIGEVPGLSEENRGPGQTEFEMRGLTSSGGASPTVGFYLDETPMTAPAASQNGKVVIDPNLYDLNRIEVLRGPQGTLYGSGSMGGTIKVITNQPNLNEYLGSVEATVSGTDGGGINNGENAMVNIPLVPGQLALRMVGSQSETSGWIDRIVVGDFPAESSAGPRPNLLGLPVLADHKDVNWEDFAAGRISLLWKPTEELSITPSIFSQYIQLGGPSEFDSVPGTLAHYQPFDIPEPFRDQILSYGITINYKMPWFDVTSATNKWQRSELISQDEAENIQAAFGFPSVYPGQGGAGGGNYLEIDKTRQISEEFRLTSNGSGPFQWIAGAFYQHFASEWNNISIMPNATAVFGGTDEQFLQFQPSLINQEAGFGEATYEVLPGLKLTAGLRYYSYTNTVETIYGGYGSITGSTQTGSYTSGESNSGVNPKFSISYQADPDLLLYSTVAKGFRPGSGNAPIPDNPATAEGAACLADLKRFGLNGFPEEYGPDSVQSYEIGEKAQLFDRRLTINTALYDEDWKDVQQEVALSCGYIYTGNEGEAAVHGAETEIRALLAEGLNFTGTAGYTDAYLTRDEPDVGAHKGQQLQAIAPWTAGASLSYTTTVQDDWDVTGRIGFDYVGPRIDATYYPINHLPAYTIANARVGVAHGPWTATVFVNNFTNERAEIADVPSLSINLGGFNRIATNQPLTAGLTVSRRF